MTRKELTAVDLILTKLTSLESKLETLDERQGSMDKNMAVYNEQLRVHIEGTIQNRDALVKVSENLVTELAPIKKHVNMMEGTAKALGLLSVVVVIVAGLVKLVQQL